MTPAKPHRLAYPTLRAAGLAGAGVLAAVGVGVAAPGHWTLAYLCAGLCALAVIADYALAASAAHLEAEVIAPLQLAQGETADLLVRARFGRGATAALETAFTADARLAGAPRSAALEGGEARFRLSGIRRGAAKLKTLQVRWSGPLGLVRRQSDLALDRDVLVTADLAPARAVSKALGDDPTSGAKISLRTGQGGEFRALRAYATGDERRLIDWKRSASRGALLVKEFQLEQNYPVVLAVDCGRQMVEPIDGRPRVDRALSAALALGWAGLSIGDRIKLIGFEAAVRANSPFVSGPGAFAALQAAGAEIDYSTEATNYALALHAIAASLDRRGLVVIFTEFTDATGAELMLESVGHLARRHAIMFVVFRDDELEALKAAPPQTPEDVSRAIVAQSLLRERALVLERLRRMGVRAVETTPDRMSGALVDAYLDLKRREFG